MRIGRVLTVLIAVLALMNYICVAEMVRSVKTSDQLHLFVKMLESQFEGGAWRIGYIGHIGSRKFQDNGTPMTFKVTFKDALQEMASPEKFRLSSE